MSGDLLHTKLFIPATRPSFVSRPHILKKLNQGVTQGHKLTLVSAPAGFGKTTLISSWIDHLRLTIDDLRLAALQEGPIVNLQSKIANHVAWLSLDESDNDLTRFLTYLIAAFDQMGDSAKSAEEILQASPTPPVIPLLTALVNELTSIKDRIIFVLDDYHVIEAAPIDAALTFLLEHLPSWVHLVIVTREDPNLPLSRLRTRHQLTEIRATDLRFTSDEAAAFLNETMGLNLSTGEVTVLEARTEGWIAGLQLAALSMQGREDAASFVQAFAGDNRYIVDYLVEEVLHHQPEHVRHFLLQTAILNRLSGPLCDAVTGQSDSDTMLQTLERGNLFVIPLDDKRHWYRYHHLFADVLQAHLRKEQPAQVPVLQQRASVWYEQNELMAEAIRHALAAAAFERAASLLEQVWPIMDRNRQAATWLAWVKAVPEALLSTRPVLTLDYAWALLSTGALDAGEARLQDMERWLDTPPEAMVVVDEARWQSLSASLATARAYHAQARGRVADTIQYTRRAFELLPKDDFLQRGRPAAILALAYWSNGDLPAAARSLVVAMANMQLAGNIQFAITGTYVLADIQRTVGHLHEAIGWCNHSIQLAAEHGEPTPKGTADVHLGLSGLYLERGDLVAAAHHLRQSETLGQKAASPYWGYRLRLAQAQLKEAQGALDDALERLDEAEQHYVPGPAPEVRPTAALKARVWLKQGRLAEAQRWVQEQNLSADDDLTYLREFEHITLARVLMASASYEKAAELLARLLMAAEEAGRVGSAIEILLLQALMHQGQGNLAAALTPLGRALALAEPEGYIRIFVDERSPLAQLLAAAAAHGIAPDYTSKLLALLETATRPDAVSPTAQPLVEPLSQRELEVLQLVAEGLSNREIGARLFLALDTIKGYNRRIYNKLDVKSRMEAVVRGRELGLL